ncbi:hypothetical protein C0J52_14466 [Blattella germanica]|nr:hypothetical protein C0J52_14466 [Blattella germanica]
MYINRRFSLSRRVKPRVADLPRLHHLPANLLTETTDSARTTLQAQTHIGGRPTDAAEDNIATLTLRETTTTALKITPNHKQRDDYTLVTKGPKPTTTPPSTNTVQTANKFQILQVEDTNEEVSQTTEDHPPVIERQPPITVITDENKTFAIIRELNKSTKNLKISKVKDGLRIQATSPEDKDSVQNTCDRLKLETYTWAANSAKPIRAVIKRLPSDVPTEDLQEELKALNFDINSVTQMVKKVNATYARTPPLTGQEDRHAPPPTTQNRRQTYAQAAGQTPPPSNNTIAGMLADPSVRETFNIIYELQKELKKETSAINKVAIVLEAIRLIESLND